MADSTRPECLDRFGNARSTGCFRCEVCSRHGSKPACFNMVTFAIKTFECSEPNRARHQLWVLQLLGEISRYSDWGGGGGGAGGGPGGGGGGGRGRGGV